MGVSILPPSAPLPARRDAPTEDSDVDMSDDELPTSSAASIVTPGEHITSDPQWMRGHGTYVPAGSGTIISTVAGSLHKTNKLLSVQPLRARYNPEIGDLVIGRIVNVQTKKWSVDIAAPMLANLPLSSINLPGGILRRRTAVDELNIRTFFSEGDLLVAEVQSLHQDNTASLHTRSLKYGKLRNGLFTSLSGAGGGILSRKGGVVRSRRQVFTLNSAAGEIDVVLGVNGYIFISKHTVVAASTTETGINKLDEQVTETLYSSQNDEIEPAVMKEITRVSTLIKGLVACGTKVDEDTIVKVYEGAVEMEAEEQSLGGVERGVGAKGVVEAVLARLETENAG
ncbi:Exosome complex component rrp4 [Ascochyta clinopodiicola]|nr:Exosome complex component rrp4 [Ascochyta clinopodiicola]